MAIIEKIETIKTSINNMKAETGLPETASLAELENKVALLADDNGTIDIQKMIDEGFEYTYEIKNETNPFEIIVENYGNSGYGFSLDESDYYANNNVYVDNSYAMCKVIINNTSEQTDKFILEICQDSESGYNYGLLSALDTLPSDDLDPTVNIVQSYQNLTGKYTYTYSVPPGEHFIGIKYIKNSNVSSGADSFKFKQTDTEIIVEIKHLTTKETLDTEIEKLVTKESYVEGITKRPTFEQATQMIDRAIYEAEDARVLKYIGHFPDIDSLPFAGQESGVSTDYKPYTLTQNFINTAFDINKIRAIVSEPYFIGYYNNDTDYSLIGFTDKNSLTAIRFIPWVNRMSTTDRTSSIAIIEINITGSATNTIKLYNYRSIQSSPKNICYRNMDTNAKYEEYAPKAINFNAEIYLYKVSNICSNVVDTIFKHTIDRNGWLEPYYVGDPNGHSADTKTELILQFANNFVYKENMAMIKFDANCQPVWLTTEGDCLPNDIVSYGEQGDYRRFNGEAWVPMGIQSSEVFSYVDNALGTAEAAVDAIIEGGI